MKPIIFIADYIYASYLKLASIFLVGDHHDSASSHDEKIIILIPGVYENRFYFRKICSVLKKYNYSIVEVDHLLKHRSLQDDAKRIVNLLNKNKYKSVSIVGHSSGGIVGALILRESNKVSKVIAIATPFSGVLNGHLLRTKVVRELLPGSDTLKLINELPHNKLMRMVSISPSYDNQVWSKKGSLLKGAKNVCINAKGHHLVLASNELKFKVIHELK